MTDLDKLIDAVERGDIDDVRCLSCDFFHDSGLCVEAFNAFCGSLDAAKDLHDALLPGWWYSLDWVMASVTNGLDKDDGPWFNASIEDNPARSWLLAILKAYRSISNE